jgi:hypothetical protein
LDEGALAAAAQDYGAFLGMPVQQIIV